MRWLVRIVKDRNVISARQFACSAKALEECGRMVGGWLKQSRARGQQAGMKWHKQLWERICAFENITDAAREAMLGKRGTVAGARFFADWEREVVRLERSFARAATGRARIITRGRPADEANALRCGQ